MGTMATDAAGKASNTSSSAAQVSAHAPRFLSVATLTRTIFMPERCGQQGVGRQSEPRLPSHLEATQLLRHRMPAARDSFRAWCGLPSFGSPRQPAPQALQPTRVVVKENLIPARPNRAFTSGVIERRRQTTPREATAFRYMRDGMPRIVGADQYGGVADDRRYAHGDVRGVGRTEDRETPTIVVVPRLVEVHDMGDDLVPMVGVRSVGSSGRVLKDIDFEQCPAQVDAGQ